MTQDEIESLHQQLAAKQAEVDALMLEYCPSEMSQEQLDTWAAHQRPSEWKTNDELRQQVAERETQVTLLRDGLKRADDLLRTSYDHISPLIREALAIQPNEALQSFAATADFDKYVLCHKVPAAFTWVDRKGWPAFGMEPHDTIESTPLYAPKVLNHGN